MERPLVEVRGARMGWAQWPAARSVDLAVGAGEMVGLIGPNGAGKTTLLRLMAKLLAPTGGALWLDGAALATLSQRAVARHVALVAQAAPADFAFSVGDVVRMGRHPHRGRFEGESAEDEAIARAAMTMTDTAALAGRPITELSAGERQRVSLARAFTQKPRLLLLDEPTANLDPRHQIRGLEGIRRLVRETRVAAVAALHDLELASRYCARLVLMDRGAIVADGPPGEVLTPQRLRTVYGVVADVVPNAATGGLSITVLEAVEEEATTN
jgi:iron complex transport system ATP-binding protein